MQAFEGQVKKLIKSENKVTQSCLTLCEPINCSLPSSSVHGILQARVLEWVAISFSRGSSRTRDPTRVSCMAGRRFTLWAAREAPGIYDIVSAFIFKALKLDEILFAGSYSITQVFNVKMLQGPIFEPLLFFCLYSLISYSKWSKTKVNRILPREHSVIANTLLQQYKRQVYTWTSPDGQYRNQIDYILCSQRWRSSIQSAKTRLGADCGSDHELLIAKFRLKLKRENH